MLSLVKIGLVEWLQQQTLGIFWSGEPSAQMSFKSFPFKKEVLHGIAASPAHPLRNNSGCHGIFFLIYTGYFF